MINALQICAALGAIIDGFEATCNLLVATQLPAIIEGFVNDNMDPTSVCTDLFGACPQDALTEIWTKQLDSLLLFLLHMYEIKETATTTTKR